MLARCAQSRREGRVYEIEGAKEDERLVISSNGVTINQLSDAHVTMRRRGREVAKWRGRSAVRWEPQAIFRLA